MNTSRTLLLQKVVQHIMTDTLFRDMMTSTTTINKAITIMYSLDGKESSKIELSRSIGSINLNMDNLLIPNTFRLYCGKTRNDGYVYIQDPILNVYQLSVIRNSAQVWDEINNVDNVSLSRYITGITPTPASTT